MMAIVLSLPWSGVAGGRGGGGGGGGGAISDIRAGVVTMPGRKPCRITFAQLSETTAISKLTRVINIATTIVLFSSS